MREIKFRVWDEQFKRMCKKPEQIRLNIANANVHGSRSGGNVETWRLMQFTGFQDSKGNDIYEDDIVYVAGFSRKAKAIITHEHGSYFEDLDGCHRSMINAAAENDIGEIVGNIHQHPELLEQKQ